MRWLLSVMMVCGSLVLMGEDCGNSSGGDGGSAGDPGTGGDVGMGGTPGAGGSGGAGGSSASNDCGYMTTCDPSGADSTCEDYCDGLCDGGQDDVYADNCRDDARCWCWCATGICSQDDCIAGSEDGCPFDAPDESFCEDECAQICDGQDDIREAYCDGSGDVTGFCRCICKVGGNVSCVEDFLRAIPPVMAAYLYPISLAALSGFVFVLERFFPWRPEQKQLRPKLWSDLIHLVFNGHFLGLLLAGLASTWVLPSVDRWLAAEGLTDAVYRNAAVDWPLWLQIIVALLVLDFIQWCVHNSLHRIPLFWEFHKAHHSVKDEEMDWIVSFRFSWLEVIVYKSVLYLPLVFFGFRWEALMFHAIFGTLIGHLNHANLDLGHGPWRYILNSPRMHIWHHDYEGDAKTTVNFGIIFSSWDWIFGTAKMPADPPAHLGFAGVETFPENFFNQEIWPLQKLFPRVHSAVVWSVIGALVMALAWYLREPHGTHPETPMLGEVAAASQPSGVFPPSDAYSGDPVQAEKAMSRFGAQAHADGYADAKSMVSIAELAKALGAPSLVLLDVRPDERFALGHIPGARELYRSDYSRGDEIPGLSRTRDELEQLLRERGVHEGSTVVLYGDGGPEPYRLWWTLRSVADFHVRILDGGLQAWKAAGHHVAGGEGLQVAQGDVTVGTPAPPPIQRWPETSAFIAEHPGTRLVDTRSTIEFDGTEQHPKAARAGHIPNAVHLDWADVLRDKGGDHRLRPPTELRELFAHHGVSEDKPVVTYCQSGTRSAAVYFALYQLGFDEDQTLNYDGSWAEYSRLDLPVEP